MSTRDMTAVSSSQSPSSSLQNPLDSPLPYGSSQPHSRSPFMQSPLNQSQGTRPMHLGYLFPSVRKETQKSLETLCGIHRVKSQTRPYHPALEPCCTKSNINPNPEALFSVWSISYLRENTVGSFTLHRLDRLLTDGYLPPQATGQFTQSIAIIATLPVPS